jgi:hypothetical protein
VNTDEQSNSATYDSNAGQERNLLNSGQVPRTRKRKNAKLPPSRYGSGEGPSIGQFSKDANASPVFERHYSVKELAELWNLSVRTIRRMFIGEPGVVEWGTCETRMKRGYKTLRIPESVARRVHRKLQRAS